MVDQFKNELVEYGTARLAKFKPRNLNLYKEQQVTKLLDKYADKWMALNQSLWLKRQEILNRQDSICIDKTTLETEFDRAVVIVRNKFTAAYPVNL